ncbi:MAG: hypothetical protein JNK08_06910 [Sediminibacterium sp.]|nr:hypothetical protein [Sediminibacterium sp.]
MFLLNFYEIPNSTIFWSVVVVSVVIYYIYKLFIKLEEKIQKSKEDSISFEGKLREKDLKIEIYEGKMREYANELATKQLAEWKEKELESIKLVFHKNAIDSAKNYLSTWIIENENRIRKDAANRSVRNVLGKVTEHLVPFSEAMKGFNPKDIRFVGSPIDLVIFDGAEELRKDEITIYFVEVKTGTSALSKRQQLIRQAIRDKKVEWMQVTMRDFGEGVNQELG